MMIDYDYICGDLTQDESSSDSAVRMLYSSNRNLIKEY
jgi:hypothetical protein